LGYSRLKRLITEDLTRAFNTNEFKKFCNTIEPGFDLYKLTGYPAHLNIPIKDAAKQAVEYFHKSNKIINLLDAIIKSVTVGFKGEKVVFNNVKPILFEMKECGLEYNSKLNKVVKLEQNGKRNDCGYLKENNLYNFCFVSIDICGNSNYVRKYDSNLIQKTYLNFKKLVQNCVEKRNGRIWTWEGDGGLAVFHVDDFVNKAVLAGIEILSNLPIFNCTSNYLDDDLTIRIGINAGEAEYKNNPEMINSEAITEAKRIEKSHTVPMSISINPHVVQNIDITIRNHFITEEINGKCICQLKLPLLGSKI
jgi:hypothetical protein